MTHSDEAGKERVDVTVGTFNRHADAYLERFKDYQPYIETYQAIIGHLPENGDVLDVGCGPGTISAHLLAAKPRLRLLGIDLAPNMIALASKQLPDAEFRVMDSRDIGALDRQFDAIICGFCFPYLSREEVSQFITDSAQLLRRNGLLYISTMEGDYAESGYQVRNDVDRVYIYYHCSEFLIDLLERNQFRVIEMQRKPFVTNEGPSTTDLFLYALKTD